MIPNLAGIVADAWDMALRESPDPFARCYVLNPLLGMPVPSYREQLDEQPRNGFGDLIPRIVTVRRNLRRLGKPARAPRLPA